MTPGTLSGGFRPGSSLVACVLPGLEALPGRDRRILVDEARDQVMESIDLDAATRATVPAGHRWDYLLSVAGDGPIVALEIHQARDSEVRVVIAKREAARDLLREHLRPRVSVARWLWATRGPVGFASTDRARRLLDQNGIRFVGRRVRTFRG